MTMSQPGSLLWQNNGRGAVLAQVAASSFVLCVIGTCIYKVWDGSSSFFAWHPILVTLGLFCLIQSILVVQPTKTPAEKQAGLDWHKTFILYLGLPLITLGAWVVWYLHHLPGQKHFISWHGTLGCAIIILIWTQAAFGATTVYWKTYFYGTESRAKAMWKYHRYVLS